MQKRHLFGAVAMGMLLSKPVLAQDQATLSTARDVARKGMDAFDAGRFEEAAEKLGRAYQVVKVPSLALARARALKQLGRLVEAAELYLEATQLELGAREKPRQRAIQQAAQKDAERERLELLPRLSKLIVEVDGKAAQDLQVTIDDAEVPTALLGNPRPVNPGERRVVGKRGAETSEQVVSLKEGETKSIRLRFEPLRPAHPESKDGAAENSPLTGPSTPEQTGRELIPHQRTIGWVGIGVGGAGLLFGSVMGLRAMSQRKDLDQQGCADGHCFTDQGDAMDSYNGSRTMSTVGFVVAGVGLATGVALLVMAPSSKQLTAWVGPGSIGMGGKF